MALCETFMNVQNRKQWKKRTEAIRNDDESAPIAISERTCKGARRLSLPLHVPCLL